MTPRDRAIRRAWAGDGYLSTGLTAVAARRQRTVALFVQWRDGRARFRTGSEEQPPVGFAFFGRYEPGRGTWLLAHRFLSRAEIRAARKVRRHQELRARLPAEIQREIQRVLAWIAGDVRAHYAAGGGETWPWIRAHEHEEAA